MKTSKIANFKYGATNGLVYTLQYASVLSIISIRVIDITIISLNLAVFVLFLKNPLIMMNMQSIKRLVRSQRLEARCDILGMPELG